MDQITFQYPAWFVLLCILLGLGYALALYFRDRTFSDQPGWLKTIMAALRFLSVAILAILLLSPLLRFFSNEVQEPVVVIAQDLSSSAVRDLSQADSLAYVQEMQQLVNTLRTDYQVRELAFGERVRDTIDWTFNQQVTDIDEALRYIEDNYGDQNLGAVILATDGIFNRGRNPIYAGLQMKAPLYTIGMGDTTQRTDLLVKFVYHNKIAFLGDRFTVQADIMAKNLAGRTATVILEKVEGSARNTLEQKQVRIAEDQFFTTQEFVIEAGKSGVQRYRIRVNGMPDEITYANNVKDIFIEVIDGRQRILILGNSPHPDMAALKSILEINQNYEVESSILDDFDGDAGAYDLVILHQIPSNTANTDIINRLNTSRTPRLFILGSQTNLSRFNAAQGLVNIQGGNRSGNEVQAMPDPTFNLFTLPEELRSQVERFPPGIAPFGQYTTSAAGQVLAYQRIGNVQTQYPLIILGEETRVKSGVIAAEGLWKWKLFDYLQHENHDAFGELVSKIVQYLTVKEDRRKFRAGPGKNVFMSNEEIIFTAELYNNSYELINIPDVFLVVRNEQGNEFNYTFNRSGQTYQINIGKFVDGSYRYTAYVDYNGQRQTVNGSFAVQPIQLESFETVADHTVLNRLSEEQNGKLFYPDAIGSIAAAIQSDDMIKPIMYQKVQTRSIIHMKWIFLLLLILICTEWFLRRYFGGY